MPPTVMKYCGTRFFDLAGQLAHQATRFVAPAAWKGGTMAPVPRKANTPLSYDNSRGILLMNGTSAAFSKVVRSQVAEVLPAIAGDHQQGERRGGGTDFPAHSIQLAFDHAKAKNVSCVVVFTDISSAFYTCPPELVLGSLQSSTRRGEVLQKLGLPETDMRNFEERLARKPLILTHGSGQKWAQVLKD